MKDTGRRKYEMFLGVRQFFADLPAEFPAASRAGELIAALNSVIDEVRTHSAAQSSGKAAVLEVAAVKATARDELRRDLEAISRTARVMAITMQGLEQKFRAPRSVSDQELIAIAHAAAADAQPLEAEFKRRGLPEDFLQNLKDDIEEFESTVNQKLQKRESQVAATAATDNAIERGLDLVRELDVIMRNRYAGDPSTLAAWLNASHTQRTTRRPAQTTQPTPPAP